MCLAVPGKLLSITGDEPLLRVGRVRFGGIIKEVPLAFVPEAVVGDHLIVHAGVALHRLDTAEAQRMLQALQQLGELAGPTLEPTPGEPPGEGA